jgi:1,2-diacylglycerol 3-beta-galactosyltransferase
MTKKRILILTSDAGYGHRSAANSISEALVELYGDECTVKVSNPLDDTEAPEIIRQLEAGYDEMVTEDPDLYRFSYHALDAPLISDVVRRVSATMLYDVIHRQLHDFRPQVVVTTYPIYARSVARAIEDLEDNCTLVVVITDLTDVQSIWYSPLATMHFAPTEHIRHQALEKNIPATRIRVTGLPVAPAIARETREVSALRDELGWDQEKVTCLIVAGPRTRQMATTSRLLDWAGLNLQLSIVCGGDLQLYEQLKQAKWQGTVHLYDWADNMPQLMKASDFIVTKAGGLIVSEALACGLPMIISQALPGQERGNVRYVVENQAGAWCPGPTEVLATVYSWLNGDPPLKEVQANARSLGKPQAAYHVAQGIWGLASTG